MRCRSSATMEVAATSGSGDIFSVAPAASRATSQSDDRPALAIPSVAAEPREIDACLYMFALCRHLQATCLDQRGIDGLLDVDGAGRLPEAVCRLLGLMVRELVNDAGGFSRPEPPHRTITVTLRRRETTCLCTIARRGFDDPRAGVQHGLKRVQRLAAELGGSCMIRPMPERKLTAIMFNVHAVERCAPAAIRRYRANEARRCMVRQAMNSSEEDVRWGRS